MAKPGRKEGNRYFQKEALPRVKNQILMGLLLVKEMPLSLLAIKVDVSVRTIQNYIYKGKLPRLKTAKKISEILGVPIEVIFNENYFKKGGINDNTMGKKRQ